MNATIRILDAETLCGTRLRRHFRSRNHLRQSRYWTAAKSVLSDFRGALRASLLKGGRAAREIAAPAVVVQLLMTGVVTGYFYVPAIEAAFSALLAFKQQIGLAFAFISMGAIALLAELLKLRIGTRTEPGSSLPLNFTFVFLTFGLLGLATDVFYGFQDLLWRNLPGTAQVPAKVLTDQFLWTTFLASPYQALLYTWKDCRFHVPTFRERITPFRLFYVHEMLPVLVTNWAFWIPTTAILYCLPTNLQFVIAQLAVVIWILLLSTLTKKS